ncbi:MAG: ABC transporter ATP-binding protein [Bacteroidetes bacterium]|nr:MAG: ABC transporter ATP-binding protein [Bacteroidota bacterium]
MEKTIIKVEHIGKKFVLRHQNQERYSTLRDSMAQFVRNIKNPKNFSKGSKEEFWALDDISFDIQQGDRVGIIGRNGAGKSTLLKVLSRIVAPTRGRITIEGRVASLLEVGTGFHPELSGRENIFLNGAILGMSRAEIQSKFDEIVAFAEVERFLDTPVKRYSSGMYVRLAFAVAAHLEPEILIVDEVLAVGDAEFQKKCLGKMKDVAGEGRTVLFVSHNMAAIQNLCDRVIYLKKGKVQEIGATKEVVSSYLRATAETESIDLSERQDRSGNGAIRFSAVNLLDQNHKQIAGFQCGSPGIFRITVNHAPGKQIDQLHIALGIDDEYGQRISALNNEATNQIFNGLKGNESYIDIVIPQIPLSPGNYSFVLYATVNHEIADWIQDAGQFHVESGDFYNSGKSLPTGQGSFYINHSFELHTP